MKKLFIVLICLGFYFIANACSPEPIKDSQESLQEQGCCGNEGDVPPPPPPPPGGD